MFSFEWFQMILSSMPLRKDVRSIQEKMAGLYKKSLPVIQEKMAGIYK